MSVGLSRNPFVSLALKTCRNSFLPPLSYFPAILCHDFHLTTPGRQLQFRYPYDCGADRILKEFMGFTKVKICCEIILSVLLVDRKYHHVEKKRKLWKRRNSQLRARLEVSTFL